VELSLVDLLSLSDREEIELVGVVGDEHDTRVCRRVVDGHPKGSRASEK
jgi:hypothetical protein